jgi:hypothetical protein
MQSGNCGARVPHRGFVCKISKLNTKSPLARAGREGGYNSGTFCPGTVGQHRTNFRKLFLFVLKDRLRNGVDGKAIKLPRSQGGGSPPVGSSPPI